MATSYALQMRDTFTATGGTPFNDVVSQALTDDDFANTIFALSEISAIVHFTATVGTSYEQILDLDPPGDDEFGTVATYVHCLFLNRGANDCTIRFDSTGSDAFFLIPAGKWLIMPFPGTIFGDSATVTAVSAKFTSASDTLEVMAFSLNSAFS